MITLKRVTESKKVTQGVLIDDNGLIICVTLENPWKDNKRRVSCIPEGVYNCEIVNSPKYGKIYGVLDVENRDHILIHSGNLEKHTMGCILLGSSYGNLEGEPAVYSSKPTVKMFQELMDEKPFVLRVVNC